MLYNLILVIWYFIDVHWHFIGISLASQLVVSQRQVAQRMSHWWPCDGQTNLHHVQDQVLRVLGLGNEPDRETNITNEESIIYIYNIYNMYISIYIVLNGILRILTVLTRTKILNQSGSTWNALGTSASVQGEGCFLPLPSWWWCCGSAEQYACPRTRSLWSRQKPLQRMKKNVIRFSRQCEKGEKNSNQAFYPVPDPTRKHT